MNNSQFISLSAPDEVLPPGEIFTAEISFKNIGSTTWGPLTYKIGSQEPQDNLVWGLGRVGIMAAIPPGSKLIVSFKCTAPQVPGSYPFAWKMLQEGVEWFGEKSAERFIKVQKSVTVPPFPTPPDMASFQVFNTGAYITDGERHQMEWANKTGRDMKIIGSYLWTGVDLGGKIDTQVNLLRKSDGSILNIIQWDHYTDPDAPDCDSILWYSPERFVIKQNDSLILPYKSSLDFSRKPVHAHHSAIVWFD